MITRPSKDQKNFFYFVPEIRNTLWTHEIGTIARFFADSRYRVFFITAHIPEPLAPHWHKQFSIIKFPAFRVGAQRVYWPFFGCCAMRTLSESSSHMRGVSERWQRRAAR